MWQERLSRQLREEINNTISCLSDTAGLNVLVRESLEKTGQRLLNKNSNTRPWPLLPLIVCEAVSGHYKQAFPVASSLYLLNISAEIFDDIEDEDFSESLSAKYGSDIATNVGTTLLILAEKGLANLQRGGLKPHIIIRVMDVINTQYTTACIGQHLDLSRSVEKAGSVDRYFKTIELKSASITQCACKVGALLATQDEALVDRFATFGHDLGMASQIANDILGVVNLNDVEKRKMTLPVIYAFSTTKGKVHDYLEKIFIQDSNLKVDAKQIKELLLSHGAIHYATVKMEYYKQKASDILFGIEKNKLNLERLKLFLK
jgi:competence protein ComQ